MHWHCDLLEEVRGPSKLQMDSPKMLATEDRMLVTIAAIIWKALAENIYADNKDCRIANNSTRIF